MKKIFLAVSLITISVIVFLSSCQKLVDAVFPGLDVKVSDMQITIPPIPIVPSGEMSLGSFTAYFNMDSTIRANTDGVFGIGTVSSVKVKQVVITLTNGDANNNLANLQSARVTISSNADTVAANMVNVSFPDNVSFTQTINPTDSPELINYLHGTQLTYSVYGAMRRPTTTSLNMVVSITLRVK